jgi:hypothetical protein
MFAATIAPVAVTTAVAAFDRWAADRVLARVAPPCTAPAVPEVADRFEPTTQEAWENVGFSLGRDGVLVEVAEVFPDARPRDVLVASFDYHMGQEAGFKRYAREVGYAAGLDGKGEERPGNIPSRFARSYELGHSEGIAERRLRGESLEEYYRELAADAEESEFQRELETLAREAGGWDRLIGRCPE